MTRIIDGKAVSASVKEAVAKEAAALKEKGILVGLAVVIVGNDPASRVYVNNKKKACAACGKYGSFFFHVNTLISNKQICLYEYLCHCDGSRRQDEAALRAAFCAFIPIILQRRCIINSAANDFT